MSDSIHLKVNVARDVAEALKEMSVGQGMTMTAGVRRAIVLWKLVTDERAKGNRVVIIEESCCETRSREVIL